MKKLIFLFFLGALNASAQCTYCSDLKEAMKMPDRVEVLDLSATELTSIPPEIRELINLRELDLSDNFLLEIDFTLFQLPNLKTLNLANNPGFNAMNLQGIGTATPSLNSLDLSNCALDILSPDIGELKQLSAIDLSKNSIRKLPQALEEIGSLRSLDLSQNKLEGNNMHLSQLWNVQSLDVSQNEKLGLESLSIALDFKDSLRYLAVSTNVVKKALPSDFKSLQVETLEVNQSTIETFNRTVAGNKAIRKIVFRGCTFTEPEEIVTWINQFEGLEEVEFHGMNVTKAIEDIENVKRITLSGVTVDLDMNTNNIKDGVEIKFISCVWESLDQKPEQLVNDNPWGMNQAMVGNNVKPLTQSKPLVSIVNSNENVKLDFPNTTFNIPANSFIKTDGTAYTGEVRIEVKEYFDAITNALEGMPMAYSENGQDYLFTSSGMFDFRAFDDQGNALGLKESSNADFAINDMKPEDSMNLYFLNDATKKWEIMASPESTNYDERRRKILDSLMEIDDGEFVFTRRVPAITRIRYKKKKYDPTILNLDVSISGMRRASNVSPGLHYLKNKDQKYLDKFRWKIDTVLTDELFETLKGIKKDQRKADKRSRGFGNRYSYRTRPRIVTEMKITPVLERDNYRMTFLYKGENISIPVYPELSGGISRVQTKEKNNYSRYQAALKNTDREVRRIEKKERKYIEDQADVVRERQADMLANPSGNGAAANQQLLGRLRIGLGNLDHPLSFPITFYRQPAPLVQLDSIAVDENGVEVVLPNEVRNIWLDNNTYFTNNNRNVIRNSVGRVISFFVVSTAEILVVTEYGRTRDGGQRAKVNRMNIEGLTTQQVRNRIANL